MGIATNILRRSASRVMSGGIQYYRGTTLNHNRRLVISAISISNGRQFSDLSTCTNLHPPISNESLLEEIVSLRNNIQSLREDVESLRRDIHNHKYYSPPKSKLEGTEFTEAMATHFNTVGISHYQSTNPNPNPTVGTTHSEDPKKTNPFSEAMATHFNTVITSHSIKTNEYSLQDEKKTTPFSEAMAKETGQLELTNESVSQEDMEKMICFTKEKNNLFDTEAVDDNYKVDGSVAKANEDSVLDRREKEETLIRGLESEILHALEFSRVYNEVTKIPQDFPFKIEKDIAGTEEIYLSREFEGERIQIKVHKLNLFSILQSYLYNYLKDRGQFTMVLTVEISCAASNFRKVVLDCFGHRNKLMIDYVKNPDDGTVNEGLRFEKLNKDLQDGFYEYLERKGISSTTINILYEIMIGKKNREHATFFHNFKNMLEA